MVRPIHFVPDVAAAVRFYEALGLRADARSRSGHWIELTATAGELGLHDAAIAANGPGRTGIALNFVADEPLEAVERRLREAGFPPEGDQEWVGLLWSLRLTAPSFRSTSKTVSCTPEQPDSRPGERQTKERHTMATVSVRYIVDDVDDAIAFYCDHVGFKQEMHPAPSSRCCPGAICAWC